MDVHADTIAVAVADGDGAPAYYGEIENTPNAVAKLMKKLARDAKVRACYEAGPCGYRIYWQLAQLDIHCDVIAPTLIPKKSGDRIKTDRRDADLLTARMDDHDRRLIFKRGAREDLVYAGWEVNDSRTLEALAVRLTNAGYAVERGHASAAHERGVDEFVYFADDAGNPVELFCAPAMAPHPRRSTALMCSRSVTAFHCVAGVRQAHRQGREGVAVIDFPTRVHQILARTAFED